MEANSKVIFDILIVEDSATQAKQLELLLREEGFRVTVATNGRAGIANARSLKPDLVISDIQMPEMNGYEMCRLLKQDPALKDVPIILLTILTDLADVIEALNVSADCYVSKPYDEDQLLAKINQLLAASGDEKIDRPGEDLEIDFAGKHVTVTSNRSQILTVLIAIYENAVINNRELISSKRALRDINEELEKELHELQASENRFRVLVNTIPDIVFRLDPEGRFVFLNREIRKLGYIPEELMGKYFSQIIMSADVAGLNPSDVLPGLKGKTFGDKNAPELFDGRRTEDRKTKGLEVRLLPKNGGKVESGDMEALGAEVLVAEVNSSGMYSEMDAMAGRFVGTVGVIRDITDRRRLEAERVEQHEEELRLRLIIENSADSMLIVDGDGLIRFANPAAELLFARCAKELLGSPFGFPTALQERHEIEIAQPDEHKKVVAELHVTALEWYGKKSYLACLRDITVSKEAGEALRKANEELRKIDRMKTDFIAIASHELRTPLTSIKNAVDILVSKKAGGLTENQERFLSMVVRNIDRLSTMINSLLDLRKLEAGRPNLRLCEMDIVGALHQVTQSFGPQADAKFQILKVDCSEDIPTVYADPARVEQILYNLINNALKFTPEGGTVELSARQRKSETESECACPDLPTPAPSRWAEISVADTGQGISSDDQVRIFEPFYQAGGVLTSRPTGTGLGLAIVKQLVESQMGQISVESEIGKGSRFFFTLPVFSAQSIEVVDLHEKIREASKKYSLFSLLEVCFNHKSVSNRNHEEVSEYSDFLSQLMDVIQRVIHRSTDHIIVQKVSLGVTIILESTQKRDAAIVKRKLGDAFCNHPIIFEGKSLCAPTILGPATFPEDGLSTEELLAAIKRNYNNEGRGQP